MSFGLAKAIIGGGVSLVGSLIGGKSNKDAAKISAEAATAPTRTSTIEDMLSEIASTTMTDQNTQLMEDVFGQELANELKTQMQQQVTQQQQDAQSTSEQAGITSGARESTVQRGTSESQEALAGLTQQLAAGGPDAQAAIDAQMARVLESGAPAISNLVAGAGTFDDTTANILQQQLATRAAESGAAMQLEQDAQTREQLLQAIAAGQSGTEVMGELTSEEQQVMQQQQDQARTSGSTQTATEEQTQSERQQQQTTEATEQMQQEQTQETEQRQSSASDQFVNPKTGTTMPGDLGQLVRTGNPGAVRAEVSATDEAGASNVPANTPIFQQPGGGARPGVGRPVIQGGNGGIFSTMIQDALAQIPNASTQPAAAVDPRALVASQGTQAQKLPQPVIRESDIEAGRRKRPEEELTPVNMNI